MPPGRLVTINLVSSDDRSSSSSSSSLSSAGFDAADLAEHRQEQSKSLPQLGSRGRRPISPPALSRQPAAPTQADPAPDASRSLTRGEHNSIAMSPRGNTTTTALPLKAGGALKSSHGGTVPPSQNAGTSLSLRTPKKQTPRTEWSVASIEEQLEKFAAGIRRDGPKLNARQIRMAWKKGAPEPGFTSKKNWFAEMKRVTPDPSAKGETRIRTKQLGPGRGNKQEKRENYHVRGLRANPDPVPPYSFHHVEISRNILSPNTMLNFIPHLRDLQDEEEPKYRRWLEGLQNMDKTSGFATLSREEKVTKTSKNERARLLLLHLDSWLDFFSIEGCTKAAIRRYMASQPATSTPRQKSIMPPSSNDDPGSPRTVKAIRMFAEAFDRVFNRQSLEDGDLKDMYRVTLKDVVLLEKFADAALDTKKSTKDTPSQAKSADEQPKQTPVDKFLESYALLGCLICCSHSCEHGEYGVDNERKRLSIEVFGDLDDAFRNTATHGSVDEDGSVVRRARKPCRKDCYLNGTSDTPTKAWNEDDKMLLQSFVFTFRHTKIPVQCATAMATGRPCWDVNRQLDKIDVILPAPKPPPIKAKSVHWYDRYKKVLTGDWMEQTLTHDHQVKEVTEPCCHVGPCIEANCPCARARVMCEALCRCTLETCAIKFNGCACHSLGKTCLSKQRDRPCICVQLNRECDPVLCGSCGAFERADPRNADNDLLFATGCQNCQLQRSKAKAVVLGKSTILGCGYGLFTTQDIAHDDFVIEYVGELISQDEGVRREARRGDVFDEASTSSYLFTLLEHEGIWVDAAIYGNLSRFINHQEEGDKRLSGCNVTPKITFVAGEYRIKFTAMRDIKAGEELFFNYGDHFPNLTKRLLDEQEEEEEKSKKRKQGKKVDAGDEGKKATGAAKGSRRGRKPGRKPKKAFGAHIDSEPEEDDDEGPSPGDNDNLEEDMFIPVPSKRKRKRGGGEGNFDSDSEDEEFRPDAREGDSDVLSAREEEPPPRSKSRGRKRLTGPGKLTMRKSGSAILTRAETRPRSAMGDGDGDGDEAEASTVSRLRDRKARRVAAGADGGGQQGRRAHRSSGGGGGGGTDDEETPPRMRTRRQQAQDAATAESSPLSPVRDEHGFDRSVFAPIDSSRDGDGDGGGGSGRKGGGGMDDSDESSNRIIDRSRSRIRRRPARYSD